MLLYHTFEGIYGINIQKANLAGDNNEKEELKDTGQLTTYVHDCSIINISIGSSSLRFLLLSQRFYPIVGHPYDSGFAHEGEWKQVGFAHLSPFSEFLVYSVMESVPTENKQKQNVLNLF